ADTDLVYVVTDPDGASVSQATAVANVRGTGGGQVDSVEEGTGIAVDASVPSAPVVGLDPATAQLVADAVQPGDLSTVATTGSYNDLTDTPTIPSTPQEVGADPAGTAAGLVGGLAPVAQTGDYGDLSNTP